jgi:hypothetical protein
MLSSIVTQPVSVSSQLISVPSVCCTFWYHKPSLLPLLVIESLEGGCICSLPMSTTYHSILLKSVQLSVYCHATAAAVLRPALLI